MSIEVRIANNVAKMFSENYSVSNDVSECRKSCSCFPVCLSLQQDGNPCHVSVRYFPEYFHHMDVLFPMKITASQVENR